MANGDQGNVTITVTPVTVSMIRIDFVDAGYSFESPHVGFVAPGAYQGSSNATAEELRLMASEGEIGFFGGDDGTFQPFAQRYAVSFRSPTLNGTSMGKGQIHPDRPNMR